jgi:cytidylate kinase
MQIQVGAEDVSSLASHAREAAAGIGRPYVVAIDGRSGVGKSTLALRLVEALDACLLDGDAFFRGGVVLRRDTPRERAANFDEVSSDSYGTAVPVARDSVAAETLRS